MPVTALTVAKLRRAEAAESPELEWLLSSCLAQAAVIFGRVQPLVIDRDDAAGGVVRDHPGPLLVLGDADVYLGAASLQRMALELERGADIALPAPLGDFAALAGEPVYTLRGYERLERRVVDDDISPPAARESHLPVALISGPARTERLESVSWHDLLGDPGSIDLDTWSRAAAGVYFELADYYGQVRDDVLPLVPEGTRDVLEVGCGRGLTGALLRRTHGCCVTGVEANEIVARQAAGNLDEVIVGDVRTVELGGPYDVIVATELLEHLDDGVAFLRRMGGLLRAGGRVVLSVPNVGHYSVVDDLKAGRWDYVPAGPLCYTHRRFFTRASLEDWIRRAGFGRWEILEQTTELPRRYAEASGETDLQSLRTRGFLAVLERPE